MADESRVEHHLNLAAEELDFALTFLPGESKDRRELEKIYDQVEAVRLRILSADEKEAS